ncbi:MULTISPECIES: hypothetical protein [unclassified Sphingobium]|uniref:hypothetical protein n=1 Tax=unclassified Sphingobium TaxID=2611147 RepID=UPI00076FE308|nr:MULTISPECIES: hypothetical protein [unclassified Sphingobium]AMK22708.1 hypothetical protein K426_08815 [Sphingobium sp. TKS]NML90225.1 hypothetical protein [Sphingobium sp. TB-6]
MQINADSSGAAITSRPWPLTVAAILLICSLLLFWPGIASYDTVVQYQQFLSGSYDDWHPPVMARLWSILPFAQHGTAPMFALQLSGYWIGLGLLAQAVGGRRAIVLLAVGATPFLSGWIAVVIKDSQMIGALALATGLVGHFRLRHQPIPAPALIVIILCLIYATLVRANAVFSTVPLAMLLLARPQSGAARFALMIAAIPAILLLSQPINHGLFDAEDSGVRRTQPMYDLAGIAVRAGDGADSGLSTAAIEALRQDDCVRPLFWDSLSATPACQSAIGHMEKAPIGPLYLQLAMAAARHPIAYLAHRAAHLNSTERWLVPLHWPLAAPPARAEPNDLGLANPQSPLVAAWQRLAAWLTETPLAWPILWTAAALWGLWASLALASGRTKDSAGNSARDLALALFASALFQEASFAVISISSDLRYHLWPMLATAIGWLILGRSPLRRRRGAGLTIALLLLCGGVARFTLPPVPPHYAEL